MTNQLPWNVHFGKVQKIMYDNISKEKADVFLKHYSDRYEKIGRSYIQWKLAFSLMDDYYYCKRVGTRWYAFVGPGGTGKTTLMKNVFYWLDPSFELNDISMNVVDFIKKLGDKGRMHNMKALAMDEPDDDIHAQTELGKTFRKILGKARQGKYFFGICATDIGDIPPYIFRKIDVIFFTQSLGRFMMFRNRPKQKSYVIQQIRRDYAERGYSVFFQLQKEQGCLTGFTKNASPLNPEQERAYLKNKLDDFKSDIASAIDMLEGKHKGPKTFKLDTWQRSAIARIKSGVSIKEIARTDKVSHNTVSKLVRDYNMSVIKRIGDPKVYKPDNLAYEGGLLPQAIGNVSKSLSEKKGRVTILTEAKVRENEKIFKEELLKIKKETKDKAKVRKNKKTTDIDLDVKTLSMNVGVE